MQVSKGRPVGTKEDGATLVWVGAALMLAVPEITGAISDGALGFMTASETIGHLERYHNWVELGVIGAIVLIVYSLIQVSASTGRRDAIRRRGRRRGRRGGTVSRSTPGDEPSRIRRTSTTRRRRSCSPSAPSSRPPSSPWPAGPRGNGGTIRAASTRRSVIYVSVARALVRRSRASSPSSGAPTCRIRRWSRTVKNLAGWLASGTLALAARPEARLVRHLRDHLGPRDPVRPPDALPVSRTSRTSSTRAARAFRTPRSQTFRDRACSFATMWGEGDWIVSARSGAASRGSGPSTASSRTGRTCSSRTCPPRGAFGFPDGDWPGGRHPTGARPSDGLTVDVEPACSAQRSGRAHALASSGRSPDGFVGVVREPAAAVRANGGRLRHARPGARHLDDRESGLVEWKDAEDPATRASARAASAPAEVDRGPRPRASRGRGRLSGRRPPLEGRRAGAAGRRPTPAGWEAA